MANNYSLQFRWVPARARVGENERANVLARSARAKGLTTPSTGIQVASSIRNAVKTLSRDHGAKVYTASKGGKHSRELDKALPGPHTKTLHNNLTCTRASILAQMKTRQCKLKAYLYRIRAEGSDQCDECGGKRR